MFDNGTTPVTVRVAPTIDIKAFVVGLVALGTGDITVVEETGAVLKSLSGNRKLNGQYATGCIERLLETNTFILYGTLKP